MYFVCRVIAKVLANKDGYGRILFKVGNIDFINKFIDGVDFGIAGHISYGLEGKGFRSSLNVLDITLDFD